LESPKVLIADDSAVVLRVLEEMLAGAGLQVVTARDGLEAIERAVAEDVRLVILDVMMPRMNGYQACRLLKAEPATKGLPVVILTSKDQPGDRFWGLETGADYYITKDSEPHRILELVKNILAEGAVPPRSPLPEDQRTSLDILSRVNQLLDRKLYEATILSEIGQVARNLIQFDETFLQVMALIARVVDFTVGGMGFVEGDDLETVLVTNRRASGRVVEETRSQLQQHVERHRGSSPLGRAHCRVVIPPGGGIGQEETQLEVFAGFPVVTGGRLAGLLGLGGRSVVRVDRESEPFLGQVANQTYIVLENSRLFERLKDVSIRDSLTDLYNHRHSMELLSYEFQKVGRYQDKLSLLMVDIDHFKRINDEHGHLAGDAVLRQVAEILQDTLRTVDVVGRYGGEEFLAVLAHSGRDDALLTGERLRRRIQDSTFRVGDWDLRVTISVGVATYPAPEVDSPTNLVRQADQALYRAKQGGRNRVA
jgi:two-component system, cell cycle response regulator